MTQPDRQLKWLNVCALVVLAILACMIVVVLLVKPRQRATSALPFPRLLEQSQLCDGLRARDAATAREALLSSYYRKASLESTEIDCLLEYCAKNSEMRDDEFGMVVQILSFPNAAIEPTLVSYFCAHGGMAANGTARKRDIDAIVAALCRIDMRYCSRDDQAVTCEHAKRVFKDRTEAGIVGKP